MPFAHGSNRKQLRSLMGEERPHSSGSVLEPEVGAVHAARSPVQLGLWDVAPERPDAAGALLRQARVRAGVSQRRLARVLGVDQATVSRLESGRLCLNLEHAASAAPVLGVHLDALLGNTRARARRHRRGSSTIETTRSARLAEAVLSRARGEFVRRGGSLGAVRAAVSGRQPLSAGQARIAIAALRESGRDWPVGQRAGLWAGIDPVADPHLIEH